jgi:rubrerythrin
MEKENFKRICELAGTEDKKLMELFINPETSTEDAEFLRLAMIAELDAVSLYKQFAERTKNKNIKKIMLDTAEEEAIHAGEFRKLLTMIDKNYVDNEEKGAKEVEDKIKK